MRISMCVRYHYSVDTIHVEVYSLQCSPSYVGLVYVIFICFVCGFLLSHFLHITVISRRPVLRTLPCHAVQGQYITQNATTLIMVRYSAPKSSNGIAALPNDDPRFPGRPLGRTFWPDSYWNRYIGSVTSTHTTTS